MSYEEFQKRISENWLHPKEASIYVMLAKSGSLKASELARLCDISRMDAYRILRRLEDKGVVEIVMSRPMKFQAIPPQKAFDTLLKSESEKLLSMQSEENYLLSLWPSQPSFEEEVKEAEKIRIIQGRVEFNNTLRRAIDAARKDITLVTTKNGLSRLFHTGFDKDIEDSVEKGISVRILSKVSEGDTEAVDKFASITNLRYLNNPLNTQIMVFDGQEALISTALDDSMSLTSEKDMSIWTNSRDHISIFKTLFEELWNGSLDIKTVRQMITKGIELPSLNRVVGQDSISILLRNILKSAENNNHLHIDKPKYKALIGTGGIGSGMFLSLLGNHTLGREESRPVRILDRRDYCKLHIVSHYVRTLLGDPFTVLPIGKVGDDDIGRRVLEEMKATGMDMRYSQVCAGINTTFGYCFLYPNGDGGNLTIENAASSKVTAEDVRNAEADFSKFSN